MRKWLAALLVLAASGCPSVTVDQGEVGSDGPTVEFDPSNKIIPFPNNLLLDPATGKVNLPQQCNESLTSAATRSRLNQLDGFGTYEPTLNVTFTEPVDLASLQNRVLIYRRASGGTAVEPAAAVAVPYFAIPGKAIRYTNQADITACTDPVMVDQVTFVPTVALAQKSTYTVALLHGIKTANGADFEASFTWSLIRHPEPVVVLDAEGNVVTNRTPLNPLVAEDKVSLIGIDLLWKAHRTALTFLAELGHTSDEILLAWEFNTQTTTDPLDPMVAGSPAAAPTNLPLLGNASIGLSAAGRTGVFATCPGGDTDLECALRIALGNGSYAAGDAFCGLISCAAFGDVLGSLLLSKQYLAEVSNTTYTGTGTQPIRGAWSDPVKPTVVHDTSNPNPTMNPAQAQIGTLVIVPTGTPPAAGWPVVIFQHGITRSRNDAFALAANLMDPSRPAAARYAVVAIDAVNHGSRAVRISSDAAAGCADVTSGIPRADRGPSPSDASDCYAPILSPDLAATRDSFRQTVLDLHQLVHSLKACGTTACGALKVDSTRIYYLGHSLVGGNLGSMLVGMRDDVKAAVFDAAGAGWLDIIENTPATEQFQCPLVDALIDAGFLMGAKYDANAMTGLCTTDAWKAMPGYRSFAAIGRWLLDPADPANFAARVAPKTFLLQHIGPDELTPSVATRNLGLLAGQPRGEASCGAPTNPFPPSTAIIAAPTQSHWLEYVDFAVGSPECPPGNTYSHGSLLQPSANTSAALLATTRLRVDAIFYLLSN